MEVAGTALPPGEHLGKRLHLLRGRVGISRRDLAAAARCSPTTVAQVEAGQLGHLAVLERISKALGAGLVLVGVGRQANYFSMAAVSSSSDAWATPYEVLDLLYGVVGEFSLDPCSARRGRGRVKARVHWDMADDGLSHAWFGSVYMNPPYGRAIAAWTAKALDEHRSGRATLIVGLVPARTDTRWWHASVAGRADIWLLRGRLMFGDSQNSAPFPSALIIWGANPTHRARMRASFPTAWHVPAGAQDGQFQLAAD